MTTLQIYKDRRGGFRWRLKAKNGRIIANGAEGYDKRFNAVRAAKSFMKVVGTHFNVSHLTKKS